MKKPLLLILLLVSYNIFGDETANKQMEPKEPEIVLPPVILEVEDLTVENVETSLPETKELLPPIRSIPLPEAGELAIKEPEVKLLPPVSDMGIKRISGTSLKAEGTLGIGSENHILSSISLYKLGEEPKFKVKFNHEMLDGFGSHAAGSGFFKRIDDLSGSLQFSYAGFGFSGDGSYSDSETGLQGRGIYISSINRFINEKINVERKILGSLTLNAGLNGSLSSLLLTGETPASDNELLVQPDIELELKLNSFKLGLYSNYSFRAFLENQSYNLHRFNARGFVSYDSPFGLTFEGQGGWFLNSAGINTFPFDIKVNGAPLNFLNLSLSGGYSIDEYNLENIIQDTQITAVPSVIEDDPHWFGIINSKLSLLKNTVISLGLNAQWNTAMPDLDSSSPDSGGYYPYYQHSAFQFNTDLGFRWNITSQILLNTGWQRRWIDRAYYNPLDSLSLELGASDKKGVYGGNFDTSFLTGIGNSIQLPQINIDGFYQISDYIRIMGEVDDLLMLAANSRYNALMMEEPGFKATFKIQINF